MMGLFVALSTAIGLALGSFAGVCVTRFDRPGQSPVTPRHSACAACGARLAWYENVPVLSWLLLRGRCGHCGARIPARLLMIELTCGLWAGLLAWRLGPGAEWAVLLPLGVLLILVSFIDLETFLLPDIYVLPGIAAAFAAAVLVLNHGTLWQRLSPALWGAGLGAGSFLALHLVWKYGRRVDGLGLGDVKLMALIGALLGPWSLPFVAFGAAVAALPASLFWMRGPDGQGGRTAVPFGPFLSLAALAWVLGGDLLWARWLAWAA